MSETRPFGTILLGTWTQPATILGGSNELHILRYGRADVCSVGASQTVLGTKLMHTNTAGTWPKTH